jgi:hypothetical protein
MPYAPQGVKGPDDDDKFDNTAGWKHNVLERQFVITYTIRQTKIPTLLDSWVTNKHTAQNAVFTHKQPRALIFS